MPPLHQKKCRTTPSSRLLFPLFFLKQASHTLKLLPFRAVSFLPLLHTLLRHPLPHSRLPTSCCATSLT
jgi:hypothetical protein